MGDKPGIVGGEGWILWCDSVGDSRNRAICDSRDGMVVDECVCEVVEFERCIMGFEVACIDAER